MDSDQRRRTWLVRRLAWRLLTSAAALVLTALLLDLVGIDALTDRAGVGSLLLVLAAVNVGGVVGDLRRSRTRVSVHAGRA